MYAELSRKDVKSLNRLDRRRKMKYDARIKERNQGAKELRGAGREIGQAEERYEGQLSRPSHRHSANYR